MDMRELTSLYKKVLELDEGFFHWSNPDICSAHWSMALDESFILKAKLLNYYGISILKRLNAIDWEPEFPKIKKEEVKEGSCADYIYDVMGILHETLYRVLDNCGWSICHISIRPAIEVLLDRQMIAYEEERFSYDPEREKDIDECYHREIEKLYGESLHRHFYDWFSMLGKSTIDNLISIDSSTIISNSDIGLLHSYFKDAPNAPSEERELFFGILEQINEPYVVQYMNNTQCLIPGHGYCIALETAETVDNGGEFVSDAHINMISVIFLGLMKAYVDFMKERYPDMAWEVDAYEKTA